MIPCRGMAVLAGPSRGAHNGAAGGRTYMNKRPFESLWLALVAVAGFAACAPEVGSERWCTAMRDKPRGDWSANEALDFTRHCLFDADE